MLVDPIARHSSFGADTRDYRAARVLISVGGIIALLISGGVLSRSCRWTALGMAVRDGDIYSLPFCPPEVNLFYSQEGEGGNRLVADGEYSVKSR